VVLVDDSATFVAALLRTLATDSSIEVIGEANNGETGLRLIQATQPDVVLLDIVMPILDGWDVLEELRQRGPTPYVILLSSYMDAGLDRIARKHGADWGVQKGEIAELLHAIHALGASAAESVPPAVST
jgi:DNA-binding NarL/FixJ family response regulator